MSGSKRAESDIVIAIVNDNDNVMTIKCQSIGSVMACEYRSVPSSVTPASEHSRQSNAAVSKYCVAVQVYVAPPDQGMWLTVSKAEVVETRTTSSTKKRAHVWKKDSIAGYS
jgi:hypothetical protein